MEAKSWWNHTEPQTAPLAITSSAETPLSSPPGGCTDTADAWQSSSLTHRPRQHVKISRLCDVLQD